MTAYAGPALLHPDHALDDFDCGVEPLNLWLVKKAATNQAEGASRTWVATDNGVVVAYYASSTASIVRFEATKRAARNQPDPLPALLLGRLAVDRRHQGHGLGSALVKHFILKGVEVAQLTGVRVLLVHAKDEGAAAFYASHGFQSSPVDDLTMMLLVKDVIASM